MTVLPPEVIRRSSIRLDPGARFAVQTEVPRVAGPARARHRARRPAGRRRRLPGPATIVAPGMTATIKAAKVAKAARASRMIRDPDQACGRHLPGERLFRPLLRDVSERGQHRRPDLPRGSGDPRCRRTAARHGSSFPPSLRHATNLLTEQPQSGLPQRLDSSATGLGAARGPAHLRSEPRLHRRADGLRQRQDGPVRPERRHGHGQRVRPAARAMPTQVMDYYDGNTVTGLWNYAQHFAMSDNSFGTTFGPSSPGAINLVAGDTGNVDTPQANSPTMSTQLAERRLTADGQGGYSLTSDAQPYWDDCSTRDAVAMTGQNIGDLLNAAGLSLGLVPGRVPPRPATRPRWPQPATPVSRPARSSRPVQGAGSLNVPHSSNQGLCDAVHPVGAASAAPAPVRLQGRLHPAPRAVQLLRLDGQPASPHDPTDGRSGHAAGLRRSAATRRPTWTGCRSSTPQPPVRHHRLRPAGDAITKDSCPPRPSPRSASSRPRATRMATPATPIRPTSSGSSTSEINALMRRRTGEHGGDRRLRRLRRLV